ncbi:MAG: DUF3187 family protein [Mariprofundaceae bacterium]|nr:DUF3187 family protein [Mariprofundaceae bacterium]
MRPIFFLCLSFFFMSHTAFAASASMRAPLASQQLHPIMMRFFNPIPVSAFDMGNSIELEQHYASLNMFDAVPNGRFLVDTELYVPILHVRRQLSPKHIVSLRIPLYRPYNGVLDGFLNNYHRLAGLPNNGREFRPKNQMAYYLKPQWSAENRWEMGNISLEIQSQVYKKNSVAIALLASAKLPTSSKTRGWSSGKADFSLGTVFSWHGDDYFAHSELRAIYTGAKSEGSMQYQHYVRASATLGRDFGKHYSVLVQIQGGSSPYQSQLYVLEQNPWIMNFGLRIQGESALYTLSFSENITQYTTADFSFGFHVRWLMD